MAREAHRSLHEELPAHGEWVRKLARSLARDEASADDLAQEAQLAALRRPGSIRGALAPWLAHVTRNFARRNWRAAVRRATRERAAARPEALPGADEASARLEIQRRLVEELSALDPAVKLVLVRRYFDGWSAARIARETGEPAATVRWRLQRGLAELRVRLDGRGGGDGIHWRLALLPLLGKLGPFGKLDWTALSDALRPVGGAAAFQGVLTMKAASVVLSAGVIAVAVGVGVWWSSGREEAQRASSVRAESVAAAVEVSPETTRAPSTAQEAARETIAVQPTDPDAAAPSSSAAAPGELRVEGRCVDERLVPLAGVRVSQVPTERASSAATSADGSFTFAVVPDRWGVCKLRAEAPGFATELVEITPRSSGTTHAGDVILRPGGSVRGRVLGPDGAPFAGAEVAVTAPELWGSLEEAKVHGPKRAKQLQGAAGDDGRFEIEGVSVGPIRVWAGAAGMRYAISPLVDVRAGAATEVIELRLEPLSDDDRITGVVLSPEGEPVPGARVQGFDRWSDGAMSMAVLADVMGRFEIAARKDHLYDLSVGDAGGTWARIALEGVRPGTHDLELRFQEARWIEVRVHSKGGAPVEDFELTGENEDGDVQFERVKREPHPEGRARLRAPTEPFFVRVEARGFALAGQGPFRPEDPPAELAFELEPEPGVRGRVLAEGKPFAGARVALQHAAVGSRIEHFGLVQLVGPHPTDETTTDEEGRFTLKLRKRSTYVVRAEAAGFAAADTVLLELDPESGKNDIELVLGDGGALEGRVLVPAGRDPSGVIVALNRGDAYPRTVRSDVEGRFGFDGLTPGPWHLSRGKFEVNSSGAGTSYIGSGTPVVIPFNCAIREGETTYQDLDLRGSEPCVLRGRLLVNGAPAEAWSVLGYEGGSDAVPGTPFSTATGADGAFELTLDERGPLRLRFSPPAELATRGRVGVVTAIEPGTNEWSADFTMGRLTGRCLSPLAAGVRSLFYESAEEVSPSCWLPILPDADGRYLLPFVPAGRGTIQALDQGRQEWSTVLETDVPARGERVLDLP